MSEKRSFIAELLHRRIPQILGLYIAGTWMAIEIGDWASERLAVSGSLTPYVFIIMTTMLPSVAIVAWFHGAPGKDRWVNLEKAVIPLNVLFAVLAVWLFTADRPPEIAESSQENTLSENAPHVTTRVLIDETGVEQQFVVAPKGVNRRMLAFFWPTKGDQEWLSYAIPWLLAVDLDRDLRLSVNTLYGRNTVREKLLAAGFDRAVNEPVALDLQMARDQRAQLMIIGQHEMDTEGHHLKAVLYEVKSGQIEATVEVAGESLIPLVGELADQLSDYLYEDEILTQDSLADLSLTELATSSEDALRLFIEGMNDWLFLNDYESAIGRLNEAVSLDPAFALAYQFLGDFYRFSGNNAEAVQSIHEALKYNYKLDSETRFILKANAYAIEGQSEKAIRVLEMWTEVHPDSFDAFKSLSTNYLLFSRVDEAEQAAEKASALNPGATELYLTKANIKRLKGDYLAAASLLQEYIAINPDDADARLLLGNTFQQTGQFDQAREVYEQVSFMAGKEFEAEMALSVLETRIGNFSAADQRLDALEEAGLTDSEQVQLGQQRIKVDLKQGRIADAMVELESFSQMAEKTMPPLQYMFTIPAMRGAMLGIKGQAEEALTLFGELEASLPPQLAGFVDLYRAMMFDSLGDYERLGEVTERLAQSVQQNNLPMLQPMVEGTKSRVLSETGDTGQAVELAERAFLSARTSFVGNDETLMNAFEIWRATAYRKAGDYETARSLLTAHLARAPSNADARLELVRVEIDAGNLPRATELVKQVLQQWSGADADYVDFSKAQTLLAELQAVS